MIDGMLKLPEDASISDVFRSTMSWLELLQLPRQSHGWCALHRLDRFSKGKCCIDHVVRLGSGELDRFFIASASSTVAQEPLDFFRVHSLEKF